MTGCSFVMCKYQMLFCSVYSYFQWFMNSSWSFGLLWKLIWKCKADRIYCVMVSPICKWFSPILRWFGPINSHCIPSIICNKLLIKVSETRNNNDVNHVKHFPFLLNLFLIVFSENFFWRFIFVNKWMTRGLENYLKFRIDQFKRQIFIKIPLFPLIFIKIPLLLIWSDFYVIELVKFKTHNLKLRLKIIINVILRLTVRNFTS